MQTKRVMSFVGIFWSFWLVSLHISSATEAKDDNTIVYSCIDRVNYWRKRACDEKWIECPETGLPPMSECTCCHTCANSQAEFDSINGVHSSFTRCGEQSQVSEGMLGLNVFLFA